MQSKAKGVQNRPDANVLVQLRKFKDITKDGEVRTDDMKKVKVKRSDVVKVHDTLMKVKAHRFGINTFNYYRKIRILSIKYLMQS